MGFGQRRLIQGTLLFLGCFVLLTVSSKGMTMGNQKVRQVIVLNCPSNVPQPEILCNEMTQSLSDASPSSVIRQLEPGEEFQARPGDLEVTLRLDNVSQYNIGGHLEWRAGASEKMQSGPRVDIDVMDTVIKPAFYAQFTAGLIRATPQMLSN